MPINLECSICGNTVVQDSSGQVEDASLEEREGQAADIRPLLGDDLDLACRSCHTFVRVAVQNVVGALRRSNPKKPEAGQALVAYDTTLVADVSSGA